MEGELARLADAIAAGGTLTSLLSAVQARQAKRDELAAAIAASGATNYSRIDRKAIERHVRAKLASPSTPSWNQIAAFLQSMQRLRDSVGFAA